MTGKMLANYEEEVALFRDLVGSESEPNILLFKGRSGSGKSFLIDYCLSTVPHMQSAKLKLHTQIEAIPTLFATMGMQVGWDLLPRFSGTVALLLEQPDSAADQSWYLGMHRHVREIGQIGDPQSRLARYQTLTDAWFADAAQFNEPFLLAIDGYEQASSQLKEWFPRDFLYGAALCRRMHVLIGGQEVPDLGEGWGSCAELRELQGIEEVEAWYEWVEKAGYQIPRLDLLEVCVKACQGNPKLIADYISAEWSAIEVPVEPRKNGYAQRKQLHKNMIQFFSLEELKEICFYLGIAYQNLQGHRDQLSTFARELLADTGRTGMQGELIAALHAERPNLQWEVS
jgi:hypothetical protein